MVSALDSKSSGLGSRPGRGHSVVFANRLCIKRIQQNSFVDFNKDCIRRKNGEKQHSRQHSFRFSQDFASRVQSSVRGGKVN